MRKKSARKAASNFTDDHDLILEFLETVCSKGISASYESWVYEYAIIRLYRAFEDLMLHCLIAAINSDTTQLSVTTKVKFPKHLTDEVCEFIIVGDGYFDFRGREGLIKTLRRFLPPQHFLVEIIKKQKYKDALEQLVALRNYAAHDSAQSKMRARLATSQQRLPSAGAWLKCQSRFQHIADNLYDLAEEVWQRASY